MSKNLLIVESPAKAKTIEKYLGKDFIVKSSYGHIRDLSKGSEGVNVDNEVTLNYEISKDKLKVVKELKDACKKVDEVWLATDEDREGEAISWHLCKVLDLDEKTTKRIVFREITKSAIEKAVNNPRKVDLNLVDAQQARRVLDRLVGFELSGLLWKKIKGKLSAGRVQSVAVKLIVEKEREILNFNGTAFFRVNGYFQVVGQGGKFQSLKAELSEKFETEAQALVFLEKCKKAFYTVKAINVKPLTRKPSSPFTTSTLQQEASRKLGFSVSRTMQNAQRLYEAGFITYMRTDSTNLSETALNALSEYVKSEFGEKYAQRRAFKNKNESAQEAHEAIRPTHIDRFKVTSDYAQPRLYELIWKRSLASQMADAQIEKTVVDITISSQNDYTFIAEGEVIKFDGFLKVYLESTDDEETDEDTKGLLPPMKTGQILDLDFITAKERFTRHASRFTEASLVKKLEELGIGRPSTYAPTISKITEETRNYVVKESREGTERSYRLITFKNDQIASKDETEMTGVEKKLCLTVLGMLLSNFLVELCKKIMDYSFTASIEKQFDTIADGETDWEKFIVNFYKPFHAEVQDVTEHSERANGERILGKDPKSGRTVLVRLAKYGPVVQLGNAEELGEEEKPQYANLRIGQTLESIELNQALELFQLPREIGNYESLPVLIGEGRFGPYVKYGEAFISLPKGTSPFEVELDDAIQIIHDKQKADKPVSTYDGKPVTKGKGRFGPFLKWNDLYINIPKAIDPDTINEKQVAELIATKVEKESTKFVHNWADHSLAVENGRWGPFVKWKKKNIKLPLKDDGSKMTAEDAKLLSLQDVIQIVEKEFPDAFKSKTKAAAKVKKK